MTRRIATAVAVVAVAVAALASGCAGRDHQPPDRVPVAYRDVRDSAGHAAHLGKVACADCHGDDGFERPPAGLCERCLREGAECRAVGLCRAFRASLTWARVLPGARVTTGPPAGCSVLPAGAGLALVELSRSEGLFCVNRWP